MSNTDNKQVREAGYYRVKTNGKWVIREWHPTGWVVSSHMRYTDALYDEIDNERIDPIPTSPSASVGSEGLRLICEERKRQIEVEGWTPEHDADHKHGELAIAAACYAVEHTDSQVLDQRLNEAWPWDEKWWKPKGEIKNLVRAGALIAAEIDRLQSITPKE